jgi:ABC-type uncharacterized transport system ATPase subunit
MQYAIEAQHLSRRFGRTEAVHDLTLNVPVGSVFALVGPNGAGKTTTIKTMMNLLQPSGGSARVLGTDSRKLGPAVLRRIGYVSENQDLPDRSAGGALVDDEGIKAAELVSIAPEELGTIMRPLRIDRFVTGANGSKESIEGL